MSTRTVDGERPSTLRDRIRRECERRHIRILTRGRLLHLVGSGVDLLVDDLARLRVADLQPAANEDHLDEDEP